MATLTHNQMNNIRSFLFSDPIAVEAFKRLYYFLARSVDDIQLDYRENKDDTLLGVKRNGERLRFYLIRHNDAKSCFIRFADPEIKGSVFNPLKLDEYKANLTSMAKKIKLGKLDLRVKTAHVRNSKSESQKFRDEDPSLKKILKEDNPSPNVRYLLRKKSKIITGHYHPEKGCIPKNFDFIKQEVGTLSDNTNDVMVTIKFKIQDIDQLNTEAIGDLLINGAELDSIHFYQKKKNN